jgi:DNA polymerase-1
MQEKKIIVIDGHNLFRRGFAIAIKTGECPFKFVLNMFINLRNKFIGRRFVFTFDTTKSERRLKIFPEYKANRKSHFTESEYKLFKETLNDFIFFVKNCGFITLEGFGYEADDYIAAISHFLKLQYEITIVSNDEDFLQLLNSRIKIFNPFKSITITEESFQKIYEFPLKHFLDYKCMLGDKSDNINGIDGIGEKRAKQFINQFGSFKNICESIQKIKENNINAGKKIPINKTEQSFLVSSTIMDRNKQLMDLSLVKQDKQIREIINQFLRSAKQNKDNIMKLLTTYQCSDMYGKLGLYVSK